MAGTVDIDPADPVELLRALIQCPSVTPADAGALGVVEAVLQAIGFRTERITFSEPGTDDIDNLFAVLGDRGLNLAFAGHTDVVPPGDSNDWSRDPFSGAIVDGYVHGRGAVDMKGGIAAFIAAAADFVEAMRAGNDGDFPHRLSMLITGDEEGASVNGTVKLARWAAEQGHQFDACLVGEPTSRQDLGDTLKVGRRGSLSGFVTVEGVQGHTAYPERADNPMPRLLKIGEALSAPLDQGTNLFQPSNLQITSIDTGNVAVNVIPARVRLRFNVRFNDLWTSDTLREELERRVAEMDPGGQYSITYKVSSEAFHKISQQLIDAVTAGVVAATGRTPDQTTGGGTSDARFIKDYCPVVELGLVGTTMHQVNESVPVDELKDLKAVYGSVLRHFFRAT